MRRCGIAKIGSLLENYVFLSLHMCDQISLVMCLFAVRTRLHPPHPTCTPPFLQSSSPGPLLPRHLPAAAARSSSGLV